MKLRKLRNDLRLPQSFVAQKIGVSIATVKRWEREGAGKMNFSYAQKAAHAYGCKTIDEFFKLAIGD